LNVSRQLRDRRLTLTSSAEPLNSRKRWPLALFAGSPVRIRCHLHADSVLTVMYG